MWRALERLRTLDDHDPLFAAHLRGESPWLSSAKIKLVDACNLRCFMCDYWKLRRDGELDSARWCALIDELATLGCEKIHFTGGELFLRRDAVSLLEHTASRGMRVNLTTNGTLLTAARIDRLLALPVRSVTLSIDSPVRRIHDALRGQEGAFKRTVKALDRLLARRSRKTRVRVNTVVSARNLDSLVEAPAFFAERPVDGWLLIPVDPKGDAAPGTVGVAPDGGGVLGRAAIERYNARIAPVLAESIAAPGFDPWIFGTRPDAVQEAAAQRYARGYYRSHPCLVPWFHTLINAVGDVYPCCMTHRRLQPLGNVRHDSLVELFASEAYVAFRRAMLERRPEVCHHCDDFLRENRALAAHLGERATPWRPIVSRDGSGESP